MVKVPIPARTPKLRSSKHVQCLGKLGKKKAVAVYLLASLRHGTISTEYSMLHIKTLYLSYS